MVQDKDITDISKMRAKHSRKSSHEQTLKNSAASTSAKRGLDCRLLVVPVGHASEFECELDADANYNVLFLPRNRNQVLSIAQERKTLDDLFNVDSKRYSGAVPIIPVDYPLPKDISAGESLLYTYKEAINLLEYGLLAASQVLISGGFRRGMYIADADSLKNIASFSREVGLSFVDVKREELCQYHLATALVDGVVKNSARNVSKLELSTLLCIGSRSAGYQAYARDWDSYIACMKESIFSGMFKYHEPVSIGIEKRNETKILEF